MFFLPVNVCFCIFELIPFLVSLSRDTSDCSNSFSNTGSNRISEDNGRAVSVFIGTCLGNIPPMILCRPAFVNHCSMATWFHLPAGRLF